MSEPNTTTHRPPAVPVARGQGREALCRALVRLVAREGFDGITFRSVAAEAGVTHGLASYHFGTREAMINEALAWAVEHTIESTLLASADGGIEQFAADVPDAVAKSPEDAIFQYDMLLRALRNPELRDDVRRSYDEYIDMVGAFLRTLGVESLPLARLVFAALDGLTLQQLLYDDAELTKETLDTLREILALLGTDTPATTPIESSTL